MPRIRSEKPSEKPSPPQAGVKPEAGPDIFEQKKQLFNELKQAGRGLTSEEKEQLVRRMLEDSVEDGLELASQYGLIQVELLRGFLNYNFILKHPDLTKEIIDYLEKNDSYLEASGRNFRNHLEDRQAVIKLFPAGLPMSGLGDWRLERHVEQANSLKVLGDKGMELYEKIKKYYEPLLAQQQFRPKKESSVKAKIGKRSGAEIGEEYLEEILLALEGHYYAEQLRQIIFDYLRQTQLAGQGPVTEDQRNQLIKKFLFLASKDRVAIEALFSRPLINKEETEKILKELGVNIEDEQIKRKLKNAEFKLLAPLAQVEKNLAQEKLIKELKESAAKRGFEADKIKVRKVTGPRTAYYEISFEGERKAPTFDLESFEKKEILLKDKKNSDIFHIEIVGNKTIFFKHLIGINKYYVSSSEEHFPPPPADWYKFIRTIKVIGNDLLFLATQETEPHYEKRFIVDNNKRYELPDEMTLGSAGSFTKIGDSLFVVFYKGGVTQLMRVNQQGEWIPETGENEYRSISNVINVGGQCVFLAWKKTEEGMIQVLVRAGKEVKRFKADENIILVSINDQLVLKVRGPDENYVIYPDGSRSANYEGLADYVAGADNQIVFQASRAGKSWLVFKSSGAEAKEEPLEFFLNQRIEESVLVGDTLLFVIRDRDRYFIGDRNGRKWSPEFTDLRMKAAEDELVIAGVQGDKILTYRKKISEVAKDLEGKQVLSEFFDLTAEERKKYVLLNAIENPTREKIVNYFTRFGKKKSGSEARLLREALAAVPRFIEDINELIKEMPEIFRETVAAKRDRLDRGFIEQIVFKLFPEIEIKKRQEEAKKLSLRERLGRFWRGREARPSPDSGAYLAPHESSLLEDGDPREKNAQEVVKFREAPPRFLATGIFGRYDSETAKWTKVEIPAAADLRPPVGFYTATVKIPPGLEKINLPVMIGAEVMPERVKGGKLSRGVVAVDKGAKEISYTEQVSELPPTLSEISPQVFDQFKREVEKRLGGALTEKMPGLSEELWNECQKRIQGKNPREQVYEIEKLVRELGYYDMDNAEVMGMKAGANLAERQALMKARFQQLKSKKKLFDGKQFAGVCADFALLAAALLRKAGFAAGILEGFRPRGQTVTTADAHATAFVLWPSEESGKYAIVLVDGTPSTGIPENLQAQIQLPSLEEREKQGEKEVQEIIKKAEEKLEKIEAIVQGKDVEAIRRLSNGELEQVLDAILYFEVKESHLNVIQRLLDALEYSPVGLDKLNIREEKQRDSLAEFITNELRKVREITREEAREAKAGHKLFELVRLTSNRWQKRGVKDIYELLEIASSAVEDSLEGPERRALTAIITYLRAKQMAAKEQR